MYINLRYPFVRFDFDDGFVFLGHHQTGRVRGPQHVDKQVVREHVELLHLVARDVHHPSDSVPATGESMNE